MSMEIFEVRVFGANGVSSDIEGREGSYIRFTKFHGGEAQGPMIQITGRDGERNAGYVQLNKQDAVLVASALLRFATDDGVLEGSEYGDWAEVWREKS